MSGRGRPSYFTREQTMSRSQARFPPSDGKFLYEGDDSEVPSIDGGRTSHDPHASRCHTPDPGSESDEETTACATPDVDAPVLNQPIASSVQSEATSTVLDRTVPRVRFRSRVRISTGIGRRQRFSDGISSNASSISGSRSSSISAPLRTHHTGKNGWGPLGSRVNAPSSQVAVRLSSSPDKDAANRDGDANPRRRSARSSLSFLDDEVDEHTHLLTFATARSYIGNRYAYDWCHEECEWERRWKEQLVDEAFGKWPGRLLNRHWWWWHLEPILCSFCDIPEDEE